MSDVSEKHPPSTHGCKNKIRGRKESYRIWREKNGGAPSGELSARTHFKALSPSSIPSALPQHDSAEEAKIRSHVSESLDEK
jgi:hypothetical protein